ncbi:MAG: helix-turn-helix transcriptional regulator [Candidatus Omnitrophica bacterium]|nr:helix-turn-helix transcriptional regulator [Candidatus Omnitrophota bacterium]
MTLRTRITQAARERGTTAAEVARRLHLYRSNLSAMDAGRRLASLRTLARVAQLLDCGLGDLLEVGWGTEGPIFRRRELNLRLQERDLGIPDGSERGWVHAALLAWQRHYGAGRRKVAPR